jgi:hypothetical protein
MAISQDIISKIRKCLALSKGTNFSEESKTAMAMAKKIMDEHGLSMSDIEMDETGHVKQNTFTEVNGYTARDLWPWEKHLSSVLKFILPVEVFLRNMQQIVFVGTPSDAAMASEVFKILRSELLRISRDEETPMERRSFLDGCVVQMYRRAEEIHESQSKPKHRTKSTALVVVKEEDLKKHMEKYNLTSSTSRGSRRDDEAYWRGRDAGNSVGLNFSGRLK